MNPRIIFSTFAAAAGGMLAAALASIGVAFADTSTLTPDDTTFVPVQAAGIPPLFEFEMGTEGLNIEDVTNG